MRFRLMLSSMSAAAASDVTNFFFNISENTGASNFKIQPSITLDSLFIFTGNDITSYFRSATNCIDSSLWVMFRSWFLDNSSTDSEMFTVSETVIQGLHWLFCNIFLEQVRANIIDDSRCGMSDVAFRTAAPLGGLSFNKLWSFFIGRLDVRASGVAVQW